MELSEVVRVKEVSGPFNAIGRDINDVNGLLDEGWVLLNVASANPSDGEGGTYLHIVYSLGLPREVAERPENKDRNWDTIEIKTGPYRELEPWE